MTDEDVVAEIKKIEDSIRQLESMKLDGSLPVDLANTSIQSLKAKLASFNAQLKGSGALAQGTGSKAVGQQGVLVDGGFNGSLMIGTQVEKIEVLIREPKDRSLSFPDALEQYLKYIIATHQALRLQGIRAGSQPLSVALEKVYVSLTAMDKRTGISEPSTRDNGGVLTISAALQKYRRLVIIGDPGSGKTTLLAYLALTYARSFLGEGVKTQIETQNKDGTPNVVSSFKPLLAYRLSVDDSNYLPIILPLRDIGLHLNSNNPNPGKDGPAVILQYLCEYYSEQNIALPLDFFDTYLEKGQATIMLDGMDEVADMRLRQRAARLIEKFSERYPTCRYVVTSREVGYEGAARIGANFGLAKIRDFTPMEVHQFVRDWTRVVETTLAGSEALEVVRNADRQSDHLIQSIESNSRIADLAVNPLLLTVVALVHRYRAQLPERRSELYEEAVEVLLGHWDAAKGIETEILLPEGRKLDAGDRRSLLEPVAFWMHENRRRELERDDLQRILLPKFINMMDGNKERAVKSLAAFLQLINERSGLLIERGVGVYGFAHLTFQEYLAARVLAERDDAIEYSISVMPDAWWREIILLEAGYLSNQGTRRVSALIRAIMDADPKTEPEPYHHLLLGAECLLDVGTARVEGDLLGEARKRLKKQAEAPFKRSDKAALLTKITASNALAYIENKRAVQRFWKQPYGEPLWINIPAGDFQFAIGKVVHKMSLPEYKIASVPVTNAQYALFIQDTKNSTVNVPGHWRGGEVPPGLGSHPVVNITPQDALEYCKWLGERIQQKVSIPSEPEWEKAAKGSLDSRNYPWGNNWKELHCNSYELGLGFTTPVGLFQNGASPYGVLDMSGNVWEWTKGSSLDEKGKITLTNEYIVRGGSYVSLAKDLRCTFSGWYYPDKNYPFIGFRIVVS
jgi:formylglycine-generating enzyme required for sulfatase activity